MYGLKFGAFENVITPQHDFCSIHYDLFDQSDFYWFHFSGVFVLGSPIVSLRILKEKGVDFRIEWVHRL